MKVWIWAGLTVGVLGIISCWARVLGIGDCPGIPEIWQQILHEAHVQRVWRVVEVAGHNNSRALLETSKTCRNGQDLMRPHIQTL